MDINAKILELAARIRALADNGLVYSGNEYDVERYTELRSISHEVSSLVTGIPVGQLDSFFLPADDYVTPKIDVRAVVFDDAGRILLVHERADGLWSLPGGWADVGYSPSENAVEEVYEETGLTVRAGKLLAVHDKKCHPHPPAIHYSYKIFIRCHITGGTLTGAFDILDRGFFGREELPPLSTDRVTLEQLTLMFSHYDDPLLPATVD